MAITALILAAVGIFSLSVLNTAERTRDIGIRRALGASKGQIAREIAGSATAIATVATVIGIGAAWVVSPSLSKELSGSLLSGIGIPLSVALALLTLGIVLVLSGQPQRVIAVGTARLQKERAEPSFLPLLPYFRKCVGKHQSSVWRTCL